MKDAPREGFHSITPRIVVSDAAAQVAFLRTVFDATGEQHAGRPAEIRIGDSLVWHQRMRLAVKGAI
jgi:PhnB protein